MMCFLLFAGWKYQILEEYEGKVMNIQQQNIRAHVRW